MENDDKGDDLDLRIVFRAMRKEYGLPEGLESELVEYQNIKRLHHYAN